MRTKVNLCLLSMLVSGSGAFSQSGNYYGTMAEPSVPETYVPSVDYSGYASAPSDVPSNDPPMNANSLQPTEAENVAGDSSGVAESESDDGDSGDDKEEPEGETYKGEESDGSSEGISCTVNSSGIAGQGDDAAQLCNFIDLMNPPKLAGFHVRKRKVTTYEAKKTEYKVWLPVPHEDKQQWKEFFDNLTESVPDLLSSIKEVEDEARCPKGYVPIGFDLVLRSEPLFEEQTTVTFFFKFFKRKSLTGTWVYKPFWKGNTPGLPWEATNASFWLTVKVVKKTKIEEVQATCLKLLLSP